MRRLRDAAVSDPARRSNRAVSLAPARWARRLLLLVTLGVFILPVYAFPNAGAATLPTTPAAPSYAAPPAAATSLHTPALIAPPAFPGAGITGGIPTAPGSATERQLPASANNVGPVMPGTTPPAVPHPANILAPAALSSSPVDAAATSVSSTTLQPTYSVGLPFTAAMRADPLPSKSTEAPVPAGYDVPTGYFSGYVNDSPPQGDGNGIAGVEILLYSNALCPAYICAPVQTTSNGSFKIVCPAPGGPGSYDALEITGQDWWMDNESYHTCSPNNNTNIGTIYLVRDGTGIGIIRDDVTGKPVVGATITAETRDGQIFGYPSGVSALNGSFAVALPPVPCILRITAPNGFFSTFNYTNATPGGGSRPQYPGTWGWTGGINLGNLYIERQTLVKAEIYDSLNGEATNTYAAMTAYDAFGAGPQAQGPTIYSGNVVKAYANPGDNYFAIYTDGFMEAYTTVMKIPEEAPGTVYDIGKVFVIPEGYLKVEDQWNKPTGGSNPPWATGEIYATICSEDGYYTSYDIPGAFGGVNMTSSDCNTWGCWNLNTVSGRIGAPPLRSIMEVYPDTTGECTGIPTWPVPDFTPAWMNFTYINVTAGQTIAQTVDVNFTPGDYIAGNVIGSGYGYTATEDHAPIDGFQVSYSSTDNLQWNGQGFDWNTQLAPPFAACDSIMTQTATSFCLAVPPGNSKILVAANGYNSNWTWAHVPDYCCRVRSGGPGYPTLLSTATSDHETTINVTAAAGEVYGFAIQGNSGAAPLTTMTVEVCPAASQGTAACGDGFGFNGSFYDVPAPAGPDVVTVTAPGYSPNQVWVNVTLGGNISAGTIPMYGLGVLQGRVVTPSGQGIYLADVHYCQIDSEQSCTGGQGSTLGTGYTTSDGYYNGTVAGGWLPWASYVLAITAPGYTTDWVMGNASAFGVTTLPTIVLKPIGTNATSEPLSAVHAAAHSSPPSASGVWLQGRLVDNSTGAGIYVPSGGTAISVCAIGLFLCVNDPDGANTEGFFNMSIGPGLYYVNLSAPGYMPASYFLNASQAGWIDMGSLGLAEVWWVSGQVAIHQWPSLTIGSIADGSPMGNGIAPVANVEGCDSSKATCLSTEPDSSNGTFNVSVPVGTSAVISAAAAGASFGGSINGGFLANATSTNLSGPYTTLSGTNAVFFMDILGYITGTVWNNDTINDSANTHFPGPAFGLPYATVAVTETGNNTGDIGYSTDASGFFVIFTDGGNGPNKTAITATCPPAYTNSKTITLAPAVFWGDHPVTNVTLYEQRFGWIVTRFNSSSTGLPVPYVGTSAKNTYYSNPETGNLFGYLNLTSPFGPDIVVTAQAPDFNGTNFTVTQVNGSATTNATTHSLPAYGWVLSDTLNYSNTTPPLASLPAAIVTDPAAGLAVPGVSVTTSSTDPTVAGGGCSQATPACTSWAGQFYADAPIGLKDTVAFAHVGYVTNNSIERIDSGEYLTFSSVNLTGESVVAGVVTGFPSGLPVPDATITATTTLKGIAYTSVALSNQSGDFWFAIAPGTITIVVNQTNFVDNTSVLKGCADCWLWAGDEVLDEYSTISGFVRGLPSGLPVEGGLAALCSTLGNPVGPCAVNSTTTAAGQFTISAPPAHYILAVSDANYNTTYLPVALSPGELTNVGTLFLSEFGTVTGRVYSSQTYAPIQGASVVGCADWGVGLCAATQTTSASGSYTFSAAPGWYNVTGGASDYQSATVRVYITAGSLTQAANLLLDPIGTNNLYEVSGQVVEAANTSIAITSGQVSALQNNGNGTQQANDYSTDLGPDGTFALDVAYGEYDLVIHATPYRPVSIPIHAFQTLTLGVIEMYVMNYTVQGTVSDALTGAPIAGAGIWTTVGSNGIYSLGSPLTTTNAYGMYAVQLTNGTHTLMAHHAAVGNVIYADTPFTVEVNAAPQTYNVSLAPPLVTVIGHVVDASTGLPIAGATVVLQGQVETGVKAYTQSFTTGADGSFQASVYEGTYTATASYGSYQSAARTFTASPSTVQVTISLTPISVGGTATAATGGWAIWAALGGAGAVVAVAAVLAGRPLRRSGVAPTTGAAEAP